jgi:hypothetical protein
MYEVFILLLSRYFSSGGQLYHQRAVMCSMGLKMTSMTFKQKRTPSQLSNGVQKNKVNLR